MTIERLLRKEIQDDVKHLETVEKGSDEWKVMVENIVKLTDRVIDLEKVEIEREDKEAKLKQAEAQAKFEQDLKTKQEERAKEQAEFEKEFKLKQEKRAEQEAMRENVFKTTQIEDEKKSRIIRTCIDIGGILIPVGLTVWGTIVTLNYDKEGVIPTTPLGRLFVNKLGPKK